MTHQSAHHEYELEAASAHQNQPAKPCRNEQEPGEASPPAVVWPEYLSVRETARLLGVSERSIYGYIEKRKLPSTHQGNLLAVETAAVRQFRRQASGRPRVRHPKWYRSSSDNAQVLT